MSEVIVTETSVLYIEESKTIIGEVFVGDSFSVPDDVSVYIGTLNAFLEANPEYIKIEEYIEKPIEEDFTDYEEIN